MIAAIGFLVLWGLYTGHVQRAARHVWRWAAIAAIAGAALLIAGCSIKILISLARLILWR